MLGDAIGVGLAAPQLGISQRLLVYRIGSEAPLVTLVNPELEWHSDDEETFEEGCLSIPDVWVEVERALRVRMRGLDARGRERTVEAEGFHARVLQHEADHLDGVLMLDRTTVAARKAAMAVLRPRLVVSGLR